ncbi:MAG: universal stress protein [Deltaproteobacteria bacterium]
MKPTPNIGEFEGASAEPDREFQGALRSRRRDRLGNVLLALTHGDHPTAALRQCWTLAQSLDAELHVLQVLPPERPFRPTVADLDLVQTTRRVARCLAAARATRLWCDDVLPESLSPQRLRIRIGTFIQDAAWRAAEVDAGLIVLAPSTGRLGTTATELAHAASCPVLVARTSVPETTLLAATDLEDEGYWVLRKAVELGTRLKALVVAVHNVNCLSAAFNLELAPAVDGTRNKPEVSETRALRLVRATEKLGASMQTVLSTEIDTVDAILDQAQVHAAHMIVVGTRRRLALGRWLARSVAAEVVNRSDRSVLVTPFKRDG